VIVAAAFCPQPPLLYPALLGPQGQEAGALLRSACAAALDRTLGTGPEAVLLLGADRAAVRDTAYGAGDAGDLKGYGLPLRLGFDGPPADGGQAVPLPHALGAWLLDEAGFAGRRVGLVAGTGSPRLRSLHADTSRWVLLVMGDGSARRTEKSPGWYDPDAVPFDETVTRALGSGDGTALRALDKSIGERVLASGLCAWAEAGALMQGTPMEATVHYADAPFGVHYCVASWTAR